MRDALYRICEAGHNRQLNSRDAVQLLERSQDLTLGVLAIEQLTGAVAARQAIVHGNANAEASNNVTATQAQLDTAQATEASKKKAADDAQKKLDGDKTKLDAAKAVNPPTDASKKDVTDLTKQVETDTTDLKAAQDNYTKAQEATEAVKKNLNSAIQSAKATATGGGEFSDAITPASNTINKDTAVAVSGAVTNIVTAILNKGHLTDACISFLSLNPDPGAQIAKINATTMNETEKKAAIDDVKNTFELCKKIIAVDLEIVAKAAENGKPGQAAPADTGFAPDALKSLY